MASLARAPGHEFNSGWEQKVGFQAVGLDQNDTTPYHMGGEIRRSSKFWMVGLWSGPIIGECGVTHDFGVDSIEQMQFAP